MSTTVARRLSVHRECIRRQSLWVGSQLHTVQRMSERDHEGQTQDICKLSCIRSQAALHYGERMFLEYQLIIANIAVKESCRRTIEFNRRYHSLTMGNYNALN